MKYVFTLFAAAALCSPLAAQTPQTPPPRQITVAGTGSVPVTPDIASLGVTVTTNAQSMRQAVRANAGEMEKAMTLLKETFKISDADLCTHGFAVSAQYEDNNNSNKTPKVVGWNANNSLQVTIRDTAKAGDILGALGTIDKANAVRIDGVHFVVSDELRASVLDKARESAVQDAKGRASLYVKTAGATLGDVQTISEQGGYTPRYGEESPMMMGRSAVSDRSVSVPVSAGKSKVSVSVSVTFAIK